MNKNKDLKLDNIDQDLLSVDNNKTNNSLTDNTNTNTMNNIETSTKPPIRKTKTTRPGSPKKHKDNKGNKSPKSKKNRNKRSKKVRFKEKVDIVKVECWKQYNLEQTAEECEYADDYLEDFESGTTMDTKNEKSNTNKEEEKNKKSDDKNKKEEEKKSTPKIKNRNKKNPHCKPKKGNFVCTCNII